MVAVLAFASPSTGAPPENAGAASIWIVTLVDGESPRAVAAQHAHENAAEIVFVYEHALNGYAARMSAQAAARIANDRRVASVVADQPVSIDAKPGGGGTTGSQTVPTGVARIGGPVTTPTVVDVDVAVIDTGIDLDHPDLNVFQSRNCNSGTTADDGNGHGTHVAGTIGAKANNRGVVGVAPGARLWAARVLNNAGSGSWASVICGIDWVTANADSIEVANMSLGGTGSDGSCNDGGMHQAICASVNAGVTYAVAAGNESDDARNHVPAAYDQVITVSALADFNGVAGGGGAATCRSDTDDTFANFSNYGDDVDIIAPGVCILSTWKGGGYSTISGTSMASPHVAGAAALYKASNAGASPAQVQSALENAGNDGWNDADDPDPTKEPLLHV